MTHVKLTFSGSAFLSQKTNERNGPVERDLLPIKRRPTVAAADIARFAPVLLPDVLFAKILRRIDAPPR